MKGRPERLFVLLLDDLHHLIYSYLLSLACLIDL
jgi:hypothetical protein